MRISFFDGEKADRIRFTLLNKRRGQLVATCSKIKDPHLVRCAVDEDAVANNHEKNDLGFRMSARADGKGFRPFSSKEKGHT